MLIRSGLAVLAIAIGAILGLPSAAVAQLATVVAACPPTRATPYPAGTTVPLTVDVNGILCTNATGGGGGAGDASAANQLLQLTQETAINTNLGAPGATACATDTASCNLNQLIQRLAQRLTTINTTLGSPATAGNQATEIASLAAIQASAATTATNTGAAVPTQAPTVSIGGVGIIDSAGTNVATVKAASTLPAATDKTLVVGLNPGTSVAGTPTGAILSVQGVASMTPFLSSQSGTWTVQPGNTANTTSWLVKTNDGTNTQVLDPCQSATKLYQPISQTTSTQLFAGTSAKKTYVCSFALIVADAENISLVSGTGSVCGTNTVAMIGGTSAANGPNLAANGGFTLGSGVGALAASTVNADNVCLLQSGSGRVAGVMAYVAQ